MQAVTQPNGLQAYRTACYTYSEYLIHRYFVFLTNESDVRTTELRTEYLFISIQSQNVSDNAVVRLLYSQSRL